MKIGEFKDNGMNIREFRLRDCSIYVDLSDDYFDYCRYRYTNKYNYDKAPHLTKSDECPTMDED